MPCAVIASVLALALAPHDDERQVHTDRPDPRPLALPDEADAFSFVVYGDRTGGPAEGVAVLAQAVEETNLLGPDLVLTVGDLIEGYNEPDPWMEQMREFRGIMDGLEMPWFPVAGNHDIYWRGADRPPEEHEANFETHFGPLWYAFEHKRSWFVVLYSDEPNPATGERNFNKADCQRISPEQLDWLDSILGHSADAEHVFVFIHHPRWIGRNYGDDWDRVHARLLAAGNVTAVFGGHIHQMRYDPRDGIEYFALATVGGHQQGLAPRAGFLHQYHVVTVREDGIDVIAYPVGEALDPRAITGAVNADVTALARSFEPRFVSVPTLAADGGTAGAIELSLSNPSSRSVDVELSLESDDLDWVFVPGHDHATLAAGETRTFRLGASRYATGFDRNLRVPELVVRTDYLAPGARLPLADRRVDVPFDAQLPASTGTEPDGVLVLDGEGYASVPPEDIELPDGPFTLECWVRASAYATRQGVVTKTENSEFGLFADGGRPTFLVHLSGAYVTAEADADLSPDRWHHLAGVFDGAEVRLYVDGRLAGRAAGAGPRTPNDLPMVIGGDVDRYGRGSSLLAGRLDEVRLTIGARYGEDAFEPEPRGGADGATVLLLRADRALGPWIADSSGRGAHARTHGAVAVAARVPSDEADSDAGPR